MARDTWTRRQFLGRVGLLGAGLGVLRSGPGLASLLDDALDPVSDLLQPALDALSQETYAGLAAFVVPGPDAYSVAQGESDPAPGGVAADAHGFMLHALDHYFPYPDSMLGPFSSALVQATADTPLPPELEAAGEALVAQLDAALAEMLSSDENVPLSGSFALVLNHLATQVRASAVAGPFASPFANLSMAEKARVFELIEAEQSDLVALVDGSLDEPSRRSLSGLLQFVGNALICFTAFGAYCEWSVWDPQAREAGARPVGWEISNFAPGERLPADGWDELRGYWKGRRRSVDTPRRELLY